MKLFNLFKIVFICSLVNVKSFDYLDDYLTALSEVNYFSYIPLHQPFITFELRFIQGINEKSDLETNKQEEGSEINEYEYDNLTDENDFNETEFENFENKIKNFIDQNVTKSNFKNFTNQDEILNQTKHLNQQIEKQNQQVSIY